MEPSQNVKYYSNKIVIDQYDETIIKKYIKDSLSSDQSHLDNNATYKIVSTNIVNIIKNSYKTVENIIAKDTSKREAVFNLGAMSHTDTECIKSIFLHHFPGFRLFTESSKLPSKRDHPIFASFSSNYEYDLHIQWLNDNPLFLQYTSKFALPLSSNHEKSAAKKKLEGFWNDAQEGKNTDLKIICEGTTFNAHSFFVNAIPFFQKMSVNNLKESLTKEITINESSADTIKHLLKFAYFGSLCELNHENNFNVLLDIFALAHRFSYDELQEHVIQLLGNQLPPSTELENRCKTLFQRGILYDSKDLIDYALRLTFYFEKKEFYTFMTSNFNIEEMRFLIENANPLVGGKVISRLEKIVTILSTYAKTHVNSTQA